MFNKQNINRKLFLKIFLLFYSSNVTDIASRSWPEVTNIPILIFAT